MGNTKRFVVYACMLLEAEEFGSSNTEETWLIYQEEKLKQNKKSENLLSKQFNDHPSVTILSMDGEMTDQVRSLCPCKEGEVAFSEFYLFLEDCE